MKTKLLYFLGTFSLILLFSNQCFAWEYPQYNNQNYQPQYSYPIQNRFQYVPRNNVPINSYGGATAFDVLSGRYQQVNNPYQNQQGNRWESFMEKLNDPVFLNMLAAGASNFVNQQQIERDRMSRSFQPIYEGAAQRWQNTASSINIRPYTPQPVKSIMPESYTLSPSGFGDWTMTKNGYGY